MKVGIGVLSYDCVKEIDRCLDSLTDFYPVIIIDGKWKDFVDNKPSYRSTDGTIELAESYSNVITIESPNQPEFVNRNKYIIQGMKMNCDMMFWVDSDEYVEMPLGYDFFIDGIKKTFEKQPDCYSFLLHFYDKRMGGCTFQKRGIRYPAFMRHRDRHNQLWFCDNEVLGHYTAKAPHGLIVHQNKKFRTSQREEYMKLRNVRNPIH